MTSEAKVPVYRKIAEQVRTHITRDHQPGDLLPPETTLAAEFAVNHRTIRQALDILVHEGLIRRYRRRGTVVVDRNASGEFAIVVRPYFLRPDASPYFCMTSTAIAAVLGAKCARWDAKIYVGKVTPSLADHPQTLGLMEPDVLKRLRGVFTFHDLGTVAPQLQAARVPIVYFDDKEYNGVGFDRRWLFKLGLGQLRDAGCRSVGALTLGDADAHMYSSIARNAERYHLRTRADWVKVCQDGLGAEQGGYDAFCELWKSTPHPDGILVADDMVCRGVLRAILHLGIELPGQLRLVTHATRGVAFPYHKAVTRIEFDPALQARAAVEMMEQLLRDPAAKLPPVRLHGELMKGETV